MRQPTDHEVVRSAITRLLETLPAATRQVLGIDGLAMVLDGTRRASLLAGHVPGFWVVISALAEIAVEAQRVGTTLDETTFKAGSWLFVKDDPRRRYLLRRFGAAQMKQIERAIEDDKRSLARAVLRVGRELGPLFEAVAVVQAIARGDIPTWSDGSRDPGVSWMDGIEKALFRFTGPRDDDYASPILVIPDPFDVVSKFLDSINPILVRKYHGARDALRGQNPDRVSHAANSIVELMDRLLRIVADGEEVHEWCEQACRRAELNGLVRADGRPSKRGQLFYMVQFFLGDWRDVDESGSDLRLALVLAALSVRTEAQKWKHADDDDIEAGVTALASLLRGVEALLYTIAEFGELDRDLRESDLPVDVKRYLFDLERRMSTLLDAPNDVDIDIVETSRSARAFT